MIRCPQCQQECPDDALYCGNCATKLLTAATAKSQTKPFDIVTDNAASISNASVLSDVSDADGTRSADEKREALTDDRSSDSSFVGKVIDGKYYVIKRLAAGGMGEVYLARQKGVNQDVAIKKLHSEYYHDKEIVARFRDEAHSYARITHPNAVKILDLLNVRGQLCIVMEYVDGKTLTHYLDSGYIFTLRQIIDIGLQLADALGTVHRAGIVHRDLKTENVMLLETVPGRFSVKILDFGIAKMQGRPDSHKTKTGHLVGTPEFMSPEQCYGAEVDQRTDIYAYGILMFAMITGKLPFTAPNALALMNLQVHHPTPKLQRPDQSLIPEGLTALVNRCMMKAPEERYQSFADVITDLTCLQEGRKPEIAQTDGAEAYSGGDDSFLSLEMDDSETTGVASPRETRIRPTDEPSSEHFSFTLDESEESELSEATAEETPDDDRERSDDDFSLGELEIGSPSLIDHPPIKEKATGKSAITAAIVLILALGVGGFFLFRGTPAPQSEQTIEAAGDIASAETPTQVVRNQMPEAIDSPPSEKSSETLEETQEAVVAAAEPIAPSQAAALAVLERGIWRATLERIQVMTMGGELTGAQSLMKALSKANLAEEEASVFGALNTQLEQFQQIEKQANTARRHQNCGKIEDLTTSEAIPPEAVGFRNTLESIAKKCKSELAAPPTTL